MDARIQVLPPLLANQIAAGEVIERPASIIKELIENSLDAKATRIDVQIEGGGIEYIQIMDNGTGIHADDLPLALKRHATSKILSQVDLDNIQTLGFRGEALASIAAVARVTLTSRQAHQAHAMQISVHGYDPDPTCFISADPIGTRIEVRDLFFNTPARKQFLRSSRTEFLQVQDMMMRLALSAPQVNFELKHNTHLALQCVHKNYFTDPLLQTQERIKQVMGTDFLKNSLYLSLQHDDTTLYGWISFPDFTRNQMDRQFLYLNGRHIRDKLLQHAIRLAYDDLLYPGRNPLYVLFLQVDPQRVDVNVHPTKQEVRFRQARMIHDFMHHAIKETLYSNQKNHLTVHGEQKENMTLQKTIFASSSQANLLNEKSARLLFQYDDYWLIQIKDPLYAFDKKQAFILFYSHALEISTEHAIVQPVLLWIVKEMNGDDNHCMDEYFSKYGFKVVIDDIQKQMRLTQIPACLQPINKHLLLQALCDCHTIEALVGQLAETCLQDLSSEQVENIAENLLEIEGSSKVYQQVSEKWVAELFSTFRTGDPRLNF